MTNLDKVFLNRVTAKLQEQIDVLTSDLAEGVSSWEAYQKIVGNIIGLKEAAEIIQTINDEMSKQ